MFYLSLIIDYFKNYMKTRLTYRSDFWIEVLSDLLFNGLNLFFILVVFQQTSLLGDWNREQILFIYGYFMIPYGLFITFFNLWGFSERYIVKGEMDRILTRPAYNLWQLMLENLDPASLFSALAGAIVMGYSWISLGIPMHEYDPFVLLLLILGSMMIYAGVYISLTALAFFSDSPTGILPLIWNIQNYGRYPVTIYNKLLRGILTWALPFAFVGFYPSAYFLDPVNWAGFALLTPVVGLVFFTLGITIWNIGVNGTAAQALNIQKEINHMTHAVGQAAPDFTLPASNGKEVSLKDYRGKKLVIYFYPADLTPSCTNEACDFRDFNGKFAELGAEVIGISPDNLKSHDKFVTKHNLPFLLLSDPEHQAAEKIGVWTLKKMYGREYMGIERSTFLIDEKGKIANEWRKVKVKNHVQQVLDAVKALG